MATLSGIGSELCRSLSEAPVANTTSFLEGDRFFVWFAGDLGSWLGESVPREIVNFSPIVRFSGEMDDFLEGPYELLAKGARTLNDFNLVRITNQEQNNTFDALVNSFKAGSAFCKSLTVLHDWHVISISSVVSVATAKSASYALSIIAEVALVTSGATELYTSMFVTKIEEGAEDVRNHQALQHLLNTVKHVLLLSLKIFGLSAVLTGAAVVSSTAMLALSSSLLVTFMLEHHVENTTPNNA